MYAVPGQDTTIQVVWEKCSSHRAVPFIAYGGGEPSESEYPSTIVHPSEDEAGSSFACHGLSLSQVVIDDSDISDLKEDENFEVIVVSPEGPPLTIRVAGHTTVDHLQQAELRLRGQKRKTWIVSADGEVIQNRHQKLKAGMIYGCDIVDSDLSPQLAPIRERLMSELSQLPSGATEAIVPASVDSEHPLAALTEKGFLGLLPPITTTYEQVLSLLNQRSEVCVRLKALDRQGPIWADDEIRWHLNRLQYMAGEHSGIIPIDPLIMQGVFASQNFQAIEFFLQSIKHPHAYYITVVNQQQHWYPLVLQCVEGKLKVVAWDYSGAQHTGLQEFSQWFAQQLGLSLEVVQQMDRHFTGSAFCGALSIGFLEHRLLKTVLPETRSMADETHSYLRKMFRDAVAAATTTWQPWIWGAGLGDTSVEKAVEALTPVLVAHGVSTDHAHHRSQQAVKAIGPSQVMQALHGKAPWKSLKTLGSNVKFRFITEEELQAQISARAGAGPVGKPAKKSKATNELKQLPNIAIDPTKLCLPERAFTGGESLVTNPAV